MPLDPEKPEPENSDPSNNKKDIIKLDSILIP